MEIELTAKKTEVYLAWVADTFEKDSGRALVDLKDKIADANVVTRAEYDAAIIEKVGETEEARKTEHGDHGISYDIVHTVQRFRYNLP